MMAKLDLNPTTEWQECRVTISRFDGNLADTRKYGFTLVTVLLTANALVTTNQVAGSIVVMALLLALFMLDNYYWALLKAAVSVAVQIEGKGTKHISNVLSDAAKSSHTNAIVVIIYGLFVLVAAGFAFVTVVAAKPVSFGGLTALSAATLIELAAMYFVYEVVEHPKSPIAKVVNSVLNSVLGNPTESPT